MISGLIPVPPPITPNVRVLIKDTLDKGEHSVGLMVWIFTVADQLGVEGKI